MSPDLHGKSLSEVTAICHDLAEQRDHYKRELGLMAPIETLDRLARRWTLTPKEAAVLAALHQRKGAFVTRDALLTAIYQGAAGTPEIKILDVFVWHLRRKIGADMITTHRAIGFSLSPAGVAAVNEAVTVASC